MMDKRDRFVVTLNDGRTMIVDSKTARGAYLLADGRRLDLLSEPRYPRPYGICENAGLEFSIDLSGIVNPEIELAGESGGTLESIEGSDTQPARPLAIKLGASWPGRYVLPMPAGLGRKLDLRVLGTLSGKIGDAKQARDPQSTLLYRYEVDATSGEIAERSVIALR